jgi:hypothetical protein
VTVNAASNHISCTGGNACAQAVRCSGTTCVTNCSGTKNCASGYCCFGATCQTTPLNEPTCK